MKLKTFQIAGIPAILWGEQADRLYLFLHGQGGSKEEAGAFAEIACKKGWQTLSIDLPEHGERSLETDAFYPWRIVPELQRVMEYAKAEWNQVALRANSIGAWFSLLSFAENPPIRSLFVSPILDMEKLIENMMKWAGVTEDQLQREGVIPTNFGQKLSWEYLSYVREHPVRRCPSETFLLYAHGDNLTERAVVDAFTERFGCDLSVMEHGEHWFHTPEQLEVLHQWEQAHA